jgi:hypothetical protein
MHLNRSTLELLRFLRIFAVPYLLLAAALAGLRLVGPGWLHAPAELAMIAWTLFAGSVALCGALVSLVPICDDPPTVAPDLRR